MTNPEAKTQYEGAILQQLIKNAEQLAVITPKVEKIDVLEQKIDVLEQKMDVLEQKMDVLEQKIDKVYSGLNTLKWISITLGIGIVINIFSQPIVAWIYKLS